MRDFIREIKTVEEQLSLNESYIKVKYNKTYQVSKHMVDIQYKQFQIIFWTLLDKVGATKEYSPILASGFIKSIMGISGCIELNSKGLFGSARIIMRHIFEYLMIAKFCSLSKDILLYKKWECGKDISLRKEVLKRINKPSTEEFSIIWDLLCEFTHASKYSQQIVLDIKEFEKELSFNHALTLAFIEMSYHLLHSHVINSSMLYYNNYYSDEDEIKLFKALKKEMTELKKLSKSSLSKDTRKLIYDYKLKWSI